jgi:hypothetical protein
MSVDLASAGAMVIPGTDRLVGGGKTGILYLLDRGAMTEAQEFQALINAYDPTAAVDANWLHGPHMHGWPSWWKGADPSFSYDYHWAEKDHLKAHNTSGPQDSSTRSTRPSATSSR